MFYQKICIAFCFLFISRIQSAKLPSYLAPCNSNDPKFDDCAKASVKAAIPKFIHGNPKFHIPNLSPLVLPEVRIISGELELILSNVKIHGVEAVKGLDEFHWEKPDNIVMGSITVPDVDILADYKINGRILVLPIQGEGPFNLKLKNCHVSATYPIKLRRQRHGSRKVGIQEGFVKYNITNAHFQFDNLFADQSLSDSMNTILNENWEAVVQDLDEAISITMEELFRGICSEVFNKISV